MSPLPNNSYREHWSYVSVLCSWKALYRLTQPTSFLAFYYTKFIKDLSHTILPNLILTIALYNYLYKSYCEFVKSSSFYLPCMNISSWLWTYTEASTTRYREDRRQTPRHYPYHPLIGLKGMNSPYTNIFKRNTN